MKVIGSLILEQSAKAGAGEKISIKIFGSQTKGAKSVQNKEQEKNILFDFWSSNKMCKIGEKKEPETNINHNFWILVLDKSFKIQWCWMLVCLLTATDV